MSKKVTIINHKKERRFFRYKAIKKLVFKDDSFLYESGWMESIKRGYPCNADGEPLPWMNYAIIAILEERLKSNMNLFEYGSGYSTMFYAKRVKEVTSVEYNQYWFEKIQDMVPENVKVIFQSKDVDGEYCRCVNRESSEYDVIIVDGRDRVNCIKQAIQSTSEDGVIILDNSERDKYREGVEFAHSKNFKSIELKGVAPGNRHLYGAIIFYRENNCFNL